MCDMRLITREYGIRLSLNHHAQQSFLAYLDITTSSCAQATGRAIVRHNSKVVLSCHECQCSLLLTLEHNVYTCV